MQLKNRQNISTGISQEGINRHFSKKSTDIWKNSQLLIIPEMQTEVTMWSHSHPRDWLNLDNLYEGGPKNTPEFIYKNCVFIFTCLNFSHLQRFFHCSEQFLNSSILTPFSASAFFFLLYLFHISKMFPFEDFFFNLGKQKKSLGGEIGWVERVGTRVMPFLVKSCWALRMVWAGALVNHPSWNGQTPWVFKKTHWSWTQPLTTTPSGTLMQMGS